MNKTVNKYLLTGDKFMLEMHLKQPGFIYSACGPFTKKKKELKSLCRQEIQINHFQHDMAYGKYKDLTKRIQSDKALRNTAFKIASNPKYDVYQRGLASMVYKFFDKKSSGSGIKSMPNHKLANELHKPIIRKF